MTTGLRKICTKATFPRSLVCLTIVLLIFLWLVTVTRKTQAETIRKNRLSLRSLSIDRYRLSFEYTVTGDWRVYFSRNLNLTIEYSQDISRTPPSIAVIPFLANLLPVSWVFDAEIAIPEVDFDFYQNIVKIKQGYMTMHPNVSFAGSLRVRKVRRNRQAAQNKSLFFFSGGVDSYATLISHVTEHPTFVTVWGADIALEDRKGWQHVEANSLSAASQFNSSVLLVKSTFRRFLNEAALSRYIFPIAGDGWWHGFQHGIGLITHVAPYVFVNNIRRIYFASSRALSTSTLRPIASDPTIDNYVHIGNCVTIHDRYDLTRQEKIRLICEYRRKSKQSILLRVCWESSGGGNCCACEKCYRTICGILAENEDPSEYGFPYSDSVVERMNKLLHSSSYRREITKVDLDYWPEVEARFSQTMMDPHSPGVTRWLEGIQLRTVHFDYSHRSGARLP